MLGLGKKKEEPKDDEETKDAEGGDAGGDAKDSGKDDKNKKSEVGSMKRGDYMIHIYIEEAKNLKTGGEGESVDPMVELNVLGQSKYTKAEDNISSTGIAVWNEHIFFEPKNVEKDDLENGKIEIRLLDKGFFKDALIGYYEFDLSYIYLMDKHSMMHKWIIMSNPESENFGEVTGNLKLSITIAGNDDSQEQITDDPNPEKEDILQPPQIKPEFYQLKLRFYKGEKIVPMDKSLLSGKGSIDAYIRLDWRTTKLKTSVKLQKEDEECYWNEEFLVPAQVPIMGGRLVLKVYDEDTISDELVGSIFLNVKDIIGPKNGKFFWKNIYGAPLGTSGPHHRKMNESPELGSLWKGRILMQVLAEKCQKPLFKKQLMDSETVELSKPYQENRKFRIMCEIGQGIALPSDTKYMAQVRIAEKEFTTGYPKYDSKTDFNKWNYRSAENDTLFEAPYLDTKDIGSVFIYLIGKSALGGEKNIAFKRMAITDFLDLNPETPTWIQLEPDRAIGSIDDAHKAGFMSIKMAVHDESADGPVKWKDYNAWKKPPPKRSGIIKVRAYIFQCRDLPAADSDGTSDPYVIMWDTEKHIKKTQVIDDNLNPLFYEGLDTVYEANSIDELPPFILDVYDHDDGITDSDDFLARAIIRVKDNIEESEGSYSTGNEVFRPRWHDLKLTPNSPKEGEILVSFSVVEGDFPFKIHDLSQLHLEDQVEMRDFDVGLNILGLRRLESPGILPVKKAFISFNIKSLVPPALGSNLNNIKTQPKAPGPDPTLNTLMTFSVPLPIDKLYCPRLACSVYDCIFKGFNQPLIGNFTIPVGDLLEELREERDRETKAIQHICDELEKLEQGIAVPSYDATARIQRNTNTAIEDLDASQSHGSSQSSRSMSLRKGSLHSKSNHSTEYGPDEDQPLLSDMADADEEVRMQDRLEEKRLSALHGASPRLSVQDIESRALLIQGKSPSMSQMRGVTPKSTMGVGQQFEKFDPKLKKQLLAEEQENQERAKRDAADERNLKAQEFKDRQKADGKSASSNIIMPEYELDKILDVDKEVNHPPDALFMGLGWDEDSTTQRKHYRRFYPEELETCEEVMPIPSPFSKYDLKKGQSRGLSAGFFSGLFGGGPKTDASGSVTNEKVVGVFKAVIEVEGREEKKIYLENKKRLIADLTLKLTRLAKANGLPAVKLDLEDLATMEGREEMEHAIEPLGVRHLKISQKLADIESDVILQRMLLTENKCIVRAYMISAYDLASRDVGGFSDPYLKLKLGKSKFNQRDKYQLDEPNPDFFEYFHFESTFPGCPPLHIEVMDYDLLFGDELIGDTYVDLEDRYFLPEWRALNDKPIEYRKLHHPSSAVSQGMLKCWFEINPARCDPEDEVKLYDITPRPPEIFEVRLCVFGTEEIKMMDIEGTSDVFCRAFFDSKKDAVETDTHFRNQNGKASFNYRLIYHIAMPRKNYRMTFQAWDRDFFTPNEIIGDTVMDLKQVFEDCQLTQRQISVTKDYYENNLKKKWPNVKVKFKDNQTFWIDTFGKNDDGKVEFNGRVRIQIDILPIDLAEKNKVGKCREEPNHSPFLPPPVGRLSLSLNPFKMFTQLVGPAMRRKIYCACCCAACIAFCIFLGPLIIGNLMSDWVAKIFS